MTSVRLPSKSVARLSNMLTAYVNTLNITIDALGLEGEWTFDPLTGSLVSVEASAPAGPIPGTSTPTANTADSAPTT